MKFLFTGLLCCLQILHVAAQKNTNYTSEYLWQVRINPLGLLDPIETNISVGVDKRIKKNLAVGGNVAVYFAKYAYGASEPLSGFNLRPTLRIYSNGKFKRFGEAVFMYKHTQQIKEGWIGMNCVNGVPAYEKFTTYKERNDVLDLSYRFGLREHLFSSPSWFFECFVGLGARYRMPSLKFEDPNSCVTENSISFDNVFGQSPTINTFTISVPIGISIVMKIK